MGCMPCARFVCILEWAMCYVCMQIEMGHVLCLYVDWNGKLQLEATVSGTCLHV